MIGRSTRALLLNGRTAGLWSAAAMPSGIFISYRREDTQGFALALYNVLARRFGRAGVFMDIDSIHPGSDFVEEIERTLVRCDIMLVLIGKGWANASADRGSRRLDDPKDLVRLEIETALRHGTRIVPVLVEGARMPAPHELPGTLSLLSRRQAHRVDADRFHRDVAALADRLASVHGPSFVRWRWLAGGTAVVGLASFLMMRSWSDTHSLRGAVEDEGERPVVTGLPTPIPTLGFPRDPTQGPEGRQAVLRESCVLPKARSDETLVLFGAYGGAALSTAAMAGQDEVTTTARVVIEPGTGPLYVILSAYNSVIWRFEGDTAQVRHVIVVGPRAQGVTGVAADHVVDFTMAVESLRETRCFVLFTEARSMEGVRARALVERQLGRPLDVFGAAYEFAALQLPSGTLEQPKNTAGSATRSDVPAGLDSGVYEESLRFNPGGIVKIDAKDVEPAKAEPYTVLPGRVGLAQLVAAGSLERVDETFWIVKPIPRFPAGLDGALAVQFVLARGVPVPPGSPGHSCVISEETGEPVGERATCQFR